MLGEAELNFLCDETAKIAARAVEKARLGEFSSVAAAEDYVSQALASVIDKQGPMIAQKLAEVMEPAVQKAMDVIKPSMMEALKDYTPTFAAIVGGMIALAVLLGVGVSKRTFRKMTA